MSDALVLSRNARFQQWQSYLVTRGKRTKAGVFLVQGVRPVTLAVEHEWPLESVLYRTGDPLSSWATSTVDRCRAAGVSAVGVAPELMAELGERVDQPPEVLLLARSRLLDPGHWTPTGDAPVVVAFDRPTSPGNLGTLIRSSDAFGASGLLVSGHAADPFDPACVRATTGSLFALPVGQVGGPEQVRAMVDRLRQQGTDMTIVGTDETGTVAAHEHDFTGGTVLVVGNETRGMSAAWRDACDVVVSIPIGGAASSLGAPSAGAVGLYEITRQRLIARTSAPVGD
ncbi:rRNA methyltransferase [Rhodococcus sp. BP-316]|uniref:TrmH family RNA methyltransferase n=1 Tax=unclassified Rhodococcus (in: high G+C Gram-positive bacteria) TaxID=192944 RepID=UPI001C9B8981|nr:MULTISPECIES: TrmH family RNA methyltransferase [unclassified Rhodococcus (in: high G+C Gram-positive bacteria)]MBY6679812.1 rRNA methyltransferase [Rhodococcus sp. BP-316]MDQ1201496.1 tRNA G18 (ribose-2'-O)-methylase SpoU [Rhodococcus sp. SORGH_AS_0303]